MKYYQYNEETSGLYNKYKDVFQELEMLSNLTDTKLEYIFHKTHVKRETLTIRIHNKEYETIEITDYSDCGYIRVFISPERNKQIKNDKSFQLKPKQEDSTYYYVNLPLYLFEDFFLNLYVGYNYKDKTS